MEAASNAGIKATNGELIVIHDDDDTWHPDFLKKCVCVLQNQVDTLISSFQNNDNFFEPVPNKVMPCARHSLPTVNCCSYL